MMILYSSTSYGVLLVTPEHHFDEDGRLIYNAPKKQERSVELKKYVFVGRNIKVAPQEPWVQAFDGQPTFDVSSLLYKEEPIPPMKKSIFISFCAYFKKNSKKK